MTDATPPRKNTLVVVTSGDAHDMMKKIAAEINAAGGTLIVVDSFSPTPPETMDMKNLITVTPASPETPSAIELKEPRQSTGINDCNRSGSSGSSGQQPANRRNWLHGDDQPWKRRRR